MRFLNYNQRKGSINERLHIAASAAAAADVTQMGFHIATPIVRRGLTRSRGVPSPLIIVGILCLHTQYISIL